MSTTQSISEFLHLGMQGLFFTLLLIFTLHSVFLAYHWFTYGSSKKMSMTALAVYLSGGAVLLLTLSFAMQSI